MNHARDHFLAHAAFAADEYRHIHRRDLQNLLANFEHLRAGGQERKILGELVAVFAQRFILAGELHFLSALQQRGIELRLFERLGQVIVGAQANGFDDRADFIGAGKHDDVERAILLHERAQSLETVHFRHEDVEDDDVGPVSPVVTVSSASLPFETAFTS